MSKCAVVVLISGNGSNLQAIIDSFSNTDSLVEVVAVISNRADAYGITRAKNHGIATDIIPSKGITDRETYDQSLQECIDKYHPDLIVLAGFMRILTENFTDHYHGRMINIHPSLLPKYRGLHTHKQVLENADSQHGATIHFVTAELDGGPIIHQACLDVMPDDTIETLKTRVQSLEHQILPMVIDWFATGKLELKNNRVFINTETARQ